MARTWLHVTTTSAAVSGASGRRGRGRRARRRHQVSPGSCRRAVAGPAVREPGRVAHLVQQDDGRRHARRRPAVQEGHRRGSGGAAGEPGTAGEGCRGPHRAPDDHDERRPILVVGGHDRAPPRRGGTRRGRLVRLDEHAGQVWPHDHAGDDTAVSDTLATEPRQRLVEHGPIAHRGPDSAPRRPSRAGRPATPAASPASPVVAGNDRDEHDGRRLDHRRASPPGIGHDRRDQRNEGHDEARGRGDRKAPGDDPPRPDEPAATQPRLHRLASEDVTTSSVATASSR